MGHIRRCRDENHIPVISRSQGQIRLRAFADDRTPLPEIQVTHRACCLEAHAGKRSAYLAADIRAATVEIHACANTTPVIQEQRCLLTITENVGEGETRFFLHAATSARCSAISISSVLNIP
jgi:hypothetical protein